MTDISAQGTQTDVIQRYARAAGIAMLLSTVFGFLGEAYIPERIIADGDAAATLANLAAHPTLFRLGFATYLVEGFCDIILCVLWYIILKPVQEPRADQRLRRCRVDDHVRHRAVALLGVVDHSEGRGGMTAFTEEQRAALAYLSLRTATMIATLFFCFYGT